MAGQRLLLALDQQEVVSLEDLHEQVSQAILHDHRSQNDDSELALSIVREEVVCHLHVLLWVLIVFNLGIESIWKDHIGRPQLGNSKHVALLKSSGGCLLIQGVTHKELIVLVFGFLLPD